MNARELIKQIQSKHEWSQNQVAKEIGITSASLSNLAQEKIDGSDETYIKLAKLAGVDPTKVIIEKHMKKAGPEGQKVWATLAKALPKSAGMIAITGIMSSALMPHFSNVFKVILLIM